MKNTAMIRIKNKIRKKLSDRRGFSLGELLVATIILLLASQVLTQGMAFAVRMYNESMTRSHAKQLCSTLTNVIEKELRYTTSIKKDSQGTIVSYFSPTYGKTESTFETVDAKGNKVGGTSGGEIAIQVSADDGTLYWQRLVSSASYSSFDLKANVSSVTFDQGSNAFYVELRILKDGKIIVTNTFNVIPVNNLKIE